MHVHVQYEYHELVCMMCSENKRNGNKPANRASNSSLLLGTMLLVDGTKVQQGQWTPSFRPRLFSGVGGRETDKKDERYKHSFDGSLWGNGLPGAEADLDLTPSP